MIYFLRIIHIKQAEPLYRRRFLSYSVLGLHSNSHYQAIVIRPARNTIHNSSYCLVNSVDTLIDAHHRRNQTVFRQHAVASFSSNTPSDPEKFLCLESFPIGSIDSQTGADIIAHIQQHLDLGNTKGLEIVFQLLDRISREFQHLRDNNEAKVSSDDNKDEKEVILSFKVPNNLFHNAVNAWKIQWQGNDASGLLLSPRDVFERVRTLQLPSQYYKNILTSYNMIIHAAAVAKDPDLAEEILHHLISESKKRDKLFPDNVIFATVIDAWAKSGRQDGPMKAEAVLKKMIDLSNTARKPKATPNVISSSSVVSASSKSNDKDSPHRAEATLHAMQLRELLPDSVTYMNVLTAWARSDEKEAPNRALAILTKMIQRYDHGTASSAKPDVYCFSAVITAFANHGYATRAEKILFKLLKRYESTNDRDFLPSNKFCFHPVITVWSKTRIPEAPHRADALLQVMHDLAKTTGEASLEPNAVNINSVMNAWASSNHKMAPFRCMELLNIMEHQYDESGDVAFQPNEISFNIAMKCWAESRNKGAAERAEAILRHMVHLHESGNDAAKPNIVSYTTVMEAWARSGCLDAAKRAHALFDEMIQKYKSGRRYLNPNLQTFTTLITAWGRSQSSDGAAKAQAVYDHLLDCYRSGNAELRPNALVNNSLINAWCKAGELERAERILLQMEATGCQLSVVGYASVIDCWSRSHNENAVGRMQSLFDKVVQKFHAGDPAFQPNLKTYEILITAFARSRTATSKDNAERAQFFFDAMIARYRSGNQSLKPNVITFNLVIEAWAKAGQPEKAECVFREMESLADTCDVKPNLASYNSVICAWCRSGLIPDGARRAQALYDIMQRNWQGGDRQLAPTVVTYNILIPALHNNSNDPDLVIKAQQLYEEVVARYEAGETEMKVVIDNLSGLFNGDGGDNTQVPI